MKTSKFFAVLFTSTLIACASTLMAAPVESVESASATTARQTIDSFLGEQLVADQLKALGVSKAQVDERLAHLSETQLEQLAAQIDLLKAGGTIQGAQRNPLGPVACMFSALGTLIYNLYQAVFCWGDLR